MAVKLSTLAETARREIALLSAAADGKSDHVATISGQILAELSKRTDRICTVLRKELSETNQALTDKIDRHRRKAKAGVITIENRFKSCGCQEMRKC